MLRELLRDPEKALELCLGRIRAHDAEVLAWVEVAPQPALEPGPLNGIPFGAKDIFETPGMPTEYGSPLYRGRKGTCEAAVITHLRRRGAILLGKTHTTAFAYFDPAPTRNPRYLGRTPGGSSSGSAAAVAAGMVPFALGTQTQGSVLRPASYCGVAGFKPTYGKLPTEGVLPFAPSLDTVGLFTETAADMQLLWRLAGWGAPAEPAAPITHGPELPEGFEEMREAARTINDYEGARTHRQRWEEHGPAIGAKLAALVARGLAIPEESYRAALDTVAGYCGRMSEFFRRHPVIATPAATGPAPLGLDSTGDPRMNAPWTALGTPAIAVPVHGRDVAIQLIADRGNDDMLLATAAAFPL